MAAADIGCSLAEAAEAPAYDEYLAAAAGNASPALHVVYINTSLRTKALAHAQVPTITCTSSNVVQTVLQVRGAGIIVVRVGPAQDQIWGNQAKSSLPKGGHSKCGVLEATSYVVQTVLQVRCLLL